uniref:AbrB/MazE/SpoVT family DNA-binding domain-containing protein n=1 Tax=Acidobacterium capsulatum TaxID=33075 RepID=A0A7V4XT17_9BACT
MASPSHSRKNLTTVEATVTSKGQVTLPKELRNRMGIQRGSRVRFSIPEKGSAQVEPLRYELEDLWKLADQGQPVRGVMTFEEMNEAKTRRKW